MVNLGNALLFGKVGIFKDGVSSKELELSAGSSAILVGSGVGCWFVSVISSCSVSRCMSSAKLSLLSLVFLGINSGKLTQKQGK